MVVRRSDRASRGDIRGAVGISLAFMVAKSLLASRQSKAAVERRLGAKVRNGLYRPLYVLFSTVGGLLLVRKVYRAPHRVLYDVPSPLKWLMRAGQGASLALTFATIGVIGPGFVGFPQLRSFFGGDHPDAEPEAQGPPPGRGGEMSRRWTFGFTRHPNNWFPMAVFLLEPRMTDKRAAFAALATVHVLFGSAHEEHRLRREYGSAYDRYTTMVPFLVFLPPRACRRRKDPAGLTAG